MLRFVLFLLLKAQIVLLLLVGTCNGQGKIVNDPGEPVRLRSSKSFGELIKDRFKDSIPGLDYMRFAITISKHGKVTGFEYLRDYFALELSNANFQRIKYFVYNSLKWEPGYSLKNGRKVYHGGTKYVTVNFKAVQKLLHGNE